MPRLTHTRLCADRAALFRHVALRSYFESVVWRRDFDTVVVNSAGVNQTLFRSVIQWKSHERETAQSQPCSVSEPYKLISLCRDG